MTIAQRTAGTVVVLDLSGRLVLGDGTGTLRDKVRSLLFQGHRQVLLNLAGVDYMDSAGLGELISVYTTVTTQGGAIKVVNLTKRVSDLLAIAKVLTVFDVHESEASALRAFGAAV
jgi:anti-sigma B factor antagonist